MPSAALTSLLSLLLLVASSAPARAADAWTETAQLDRRSDARPRIGYTYRVEIGELRPTQFAVGVAEVNDRIDAIRKFDKHELHHYLKDHTGSVVIGPGGEFFLVDGHHIALAMARLGGKHGGDDGEILVKVLADWSKLPREQFFARMMRQKKLWPYDQNGNGPRDPETLPKTVHGLKNDPYRSLAYRVRQSEGYKSVDVPFLEFMWANYFRPLIARSTVVSNPRSALDQALRAAAAPEASHLPGYNRGSAKLVSVLCESLLSESKL